MKNSFDIDKLSQMPREERRAFIASLTPEDKKILTDQTLQAQQQYRMNQEGHSSSPDMAPAFPNENNFQPAEAPNKNTGLSQFLKEFGTGAAQEGVDTATGLFNLPSRGVQSLIGEDKPNTLNFELPNSAHYPYAAPLGQLAMLGGIGALMPELKAAQKIAPFVARQFPKIAKPIGNAINKNMATRFASYIPEVGDAALTGAGYGAVYGANDPNASIINSAKTGAALGGATGAAFRSPSAIRESYTKNIASKIKRGEMEGLSPEEAMLRADTYEGLPVDLGTMINSPGEFEKYKKIGMSGNNQVKKNAEVLAAAAKNKSESIKKSLIGEEDVLGINDKAIAHAITDEEKFSTAVSKIFNRFTKLTNKHNITVDRAETNKVIKNIIKAHEHTQKVGTYSKFSEPFINELKEKLAGGKAEKILPHKKSTGLLKKPFNFSENIPNEVAKSGGNKTLPRVHDIDEERKVFNELSKNHGTDWNQYVSGVYKALESASINDIENAVNKSGNYKLIDEWKSARKAHATKVIPYRKKEIEKFLRGKENSQEFHKIVTKPNNEFIFNTLPENLQKGLLYRLINPSNSDLSPARFSNKFKALDIKAQNRLAKEMKPEFERLADINEASQKLSPVLKTPDTGVKAYSLLKAGISPAIGYGAGHEAFDDHPLLGGIAGAIAGGVSRNKFYNAKAKFHTSHKTKEAYIKQKSNPSKRNIITKKSILAMENYQK